MTEKSFRYSEQPAAEIIRRLGGVRSLARKLDLTPEAVSKWGRPMDAAGTEGVVPGVHWRRIMTLLTEAGFSEHERSRLYRALTQAAKGVWAEGNVANRAKEKGDRFEREVANDLKEAGLDAHRVPLSGAVPGYAGDVKATTPTGVWIIQCKVTKNQTTKSGEPAGQAGRGAVVRLLNEAAFGWIVADDVTYLAMHQDVFIDLLKGTVPTAVNVPTKNIGHGKQIAGMIAGHDALLFRKDREKQWFAIVRKDRLP